MTEYFYLIATLPYLIFGKDPHISTETFFFECRKWLAEKDMALILSAASAREEILSGDNAMLVEWKTFNQELKQALAKARETRKKGGNIKDHQSVSEILSLENPLLMEKAFEWKRWSFLAERELMYNFDINAVMVYLLKLEILERLALFDKEKGEKTFHKLYEVTYE